MRPLISVLLTQSCHAVVIVLVIFIYLYNCIYVCVLKLVSCGRKYVTNSSFPRSLSGNTKKNTVCR